VVISSRTPEGDPNRCPICGHHCRLEPSRPAGDAPCPRCGHLFWFPGRDGPVTADLDAVVMQIIEARFGTLSAESRQAVLARVQGSDRKQVLKRIVQAPSLEEVFVGG
jgi:hypothetical protein